MISHQIHDLSAIYALDALETEERELFEQHMLECRACAEEVSRFHFVGASLTPDQPAPNHIWSSITGELDEEDFPLGHSAEVIELDLDGASKEHRLLPQLLWVAAAIAIVLGGVSLFWQAPSSESPEEMITAAAERAQLIEGSFVGSFEVDGVVVAQVILDPQGHGYVLPSESLEPLGEDRTYQLWVITATEQVISGGVLGSNPSASSFTWSGDVSGFALTREVDGGVVVSDGDVVSVVSET